jgi:hypothetical protein
MRSRSGVRANSADDASSSVQAGRVKWKVDPLPGSESTQIRPLYRSTIRWQMVGPIAEYAFRSSFQLVMMPFRPSLMIPSSEESTIAASKTRTFCVLAFGGVARNGQMNGGAVKMRQRCVVRFHVAARSGTFGVQRLPFQIPF